MHDSPIQNEFAILNNKEIAQLDHAYDEYISFTRPHQHPLLRVDAVLLAEHLAKTKEDLAQLSDTAGILEIEQYAKDAIDAATTAYAKEILPTNIKNLTGKGNLSDAQRQARVAISRRIYLHAVQVAVAGGESRLKRARSLSWNPSKEFDLDLKIAAPCPGCGAMGKISLKNLEEPEAMSFACLQCGHAYNRQEDLRRPAHCECKMCEIQSTQLLHKIRTAISGVASSRIGEYRQWRQEMEDSDAKWPSENEMLRDFESTKDTVGKSLRTIISLKPKNPVDLFTCIDKYRRSHGGDVESLWNEALEHRVIYERQCTITPNAMSFEELVAKNSTPEYRHLGHGRNGAGGIREDDVKIRILKDVLHGKDTHVAMTVCNSGVWFNTIDDHYGMIAVLVFSPSTSRRNSTVLFERLVQVGEWPDCRLNEFFFELGSSALSTSDTLNSRQSEPSKPAVVSSTIDLPTSSENAFIDCSTPLAMHTKFKRIANSDLSERQRENRNFHQLAALLSTCGFNSTPIRDEGQGSQFIAYNGESKAILRVQLKDRLTIDEKYLGEGICIAFPLGESNSWYLFPHDDVYHFFSVNSGIDKGFSSGSIPKFSEEYMEKFKIPQ